MPSRRQARVRPLLGLLLAANLSACSAAHRRDPRHSWMPVTAGLWNRLDTSQDGPSSHDEYLAVLALFVVVPVAVDLVSLPFHGAGHLLGPKGGDGSEPAPGPAEY